MSPTLQPSALEKRYRVSDESKLQSWLEQLNLTGFRSTRVCNEYFDTTDTEYYKRGVLIRLRNSRELEVKNKLKLLHNHSTVHRLQVPFDQNRKDAFTVLTEQFGLKCPLPFSFSHFLGTNKLRPLVTLDNTRKTYTTTTLIIVENTIADLGTFLEIKATTPCSADEFNAEAARLTAPLPLTLINTSYIELALQETNEKSHQYGRVLVGA